MTRSILEQAIDSFQKKEAAMAVMMLMVKDAGGEVRMPESRIVAEGAGSLSITYDEVEKCMVIKYHTLEETQAMYAADEKADIAAVNPNAVNN